MFMIASRPLGARFQVIGTAATQYSRTRAWESAGPPKRARAPAVARALAIRDVVTTLLTDAEPGLHPRVDQAHEVERLALRRRHLDVDGLALLLTRADEHGIAGAVDRRRGLRADTVLQE